MITRLQRAQFVGFIIVTILAVAAALLYSGIPSSLGMGRYPLHVELPASGNLYPRAVVTLRGADVGEVRNLRLAQTGVVADILIDNEVKIPAGVDVYVRSASAIGEQYLDFVPRIDSNQPLAASATIGGRDVHMPVEIGDVLRNANRLAATLPRDDLNTVTKELNLAFAGSSDHWKSLLDSATPLVGAASANLEPTQKLIADLQPVLGTQVKVGADTQEAVSNLAKFSAALRDSDGDLRGAIDKTPQMLASVDELVDELRDPLPRLLSSATDVGEVAEVYVPNIRASIIALPTLVNYIESSLYNSPVPGTLKIFVRAQVNDPPPCTKGFQGAHQRNPDDLTPVPPFADVGCKVPRDSSIAVRGTHNAPCPNNPSTGAMNAAGCGLNFQSPTDAKSAQDRAIETMMASARRAPKNLPQPKGAPPADTAATVENTGVAVPVPHYDPQSGLFIGPGGTPYILGQYSANAAKPSSPGASDWRGLLLGPMGGEK
jgi:phospholipid/cholesterol/gamma-HCH transport system substrate-binding protein